MKYSNKEISSMYEGLMSVRDTQIVFPAKVSYAIVRNLRILKPVYQDIEMTKAKLIRDNGTFVEDEDKGYFTVYHDKIDFVNQELEALANTENEITLTMIKMEDISNMDLSIEIMDGLYCMIEDEG